MGDIFNKLGLGDSAATGAGKSAIGSDAAASANAATAAAPPPAAPAAPAKKDQIPFQLIESMIAGQQKSAPQVGGAGAMPARGGGVAADTSFGPRISSMPMPGQAYAAGGAVEAPEHYIDRILRDAARNGGHSVDPKGWAGAPTRVLKNMFQQMEPDDPNRDYLGSILDQRIRNIFDSPIGSYGDNNVPLQPAGMADGGSPNPNITALLAQLGAGQPQPQAGIGYVQGPGDGRSDSIPAPRLADGEYVIPADVVAAIGNGSSNAGGRALGQMVTSTRKDFKNHLATLPKPRK